MQNCGKEALITMFKDSSLPFGIIRVELDETGRPADWIFLCCNQALEALTGRTRAELLSNSFLTLRPDGASEWMGPFYTAAFEKSPARLEVQDEARKFHLYIDCLPIDEAGECALLLRNSWKEDTYRKKLEEQIVSFRNIHKSMSSGAWHLTFNDRWERVSVEWSDTLRQMLGFHSEKEFPNAFEAWTRQLHPEDEARVLSAYEAVVEDTTGEQPFDVEYRLRHKDGTYHWFHTTGGLSRRADGSPEFFDGIFVNTDEKHETRERFQRALREAQTARQEAELDHEIISSVSRLYFSIFRIDLKKNFYEEISSDNSVHRLTGHRGMAQQKLKIAYQATEKANEAKTAFLLNMSHDIRTPMNAILGYAHLMRKELTDPKLLHYQEMIEESGSLLLSIINNVLDMAKIESGRLELNEDYNRVGDVVGKIVAVFQGEARKKNLTLTRVQKATKLDILCDVTKLQELFTNLISNAVKYTPPGGTVTVTTEELPCAQPGHVTLRTEVADTGIGISREFLPHLFEPFSRERNTTAGKVLGTGLGMPIVRSLVELMGGTITVESEQGKGSKFTVTLTHKLADQAHCEKKPAGTEEQTDHCFTGKRLLLAEDNDLNAEIATAFLQDMGFTVDRAVDGADCVDRYQHEAAGTYGLILMDIQMPNMDGYQATLAIRGLPDKEKAGIPIVAMTANAFAEDRQKAFNVGMNGHIAKPINTEILRETLRELL